MSGLGRLIKYEMKAMGRIMLPIYGAFIVASVLFGLSLSFGVSINDSEIVRNATGTTVFQTVMSVIYILLAVAVVVFTLVLLIQRFYKNLLGNEGYLCFTLPVGVNAHILNKVLSAGLWMFFGALCGGISALILTMFFVTPAELLSSVQRTLNEITNFIGGFRIVLIILEAVILAVCLAAEAGIKIYAAISVGQLWSKHRIAGAILAYIGFGVIESICASLAMRFIPQDISFMSKVSEFGLLQLSMGMMFLIAAVLIAIYWIVINRVLEKNLNLQ